MYEQQYNPYAANIKIVKDYFKRGRILVLAIFHIVLAALPILAYVSLSNTLSSDYYSIFVLPSSFLSLFYVLIGIAYILVRVKSSNPTAKVTPRGGFNFLTVLAVFQLIYAIISAIVCFIFAIVIWAASSTIINEIERDLVYLFNYSTIRTIISVLPLFMLIIPFFLVFTAINRLRFYGGAKYSMNSVNLSNNGAAAYAVGNICLTVIKAISYVFYILLIVYIISMVSQVSNMYGMGSRSNNISVFPYIALILCLIVDLFVSIFNAVVALGYKNHINIEKTGYNNAPYGGGQNNYGAPAAQTPYASAPSAPAYSNNPNPYAGTPNPYAAAPNPYANTPNPNANTPETTPAASTPEPVSAAPDPAASTPEPVSAAPEQQNAGKVCSSCGSPVGENDPFCGNCGSKL